MGPKVDKNVLSMNVTGRNPHKMCQWRRHLENRGSNGYRLVGGTKMGKEMLGIEMEWHKISLTSYVHLFGWHVVFLFS